MARKYCNDAPCPNFKGEELYTSEAVCRLGFIVIFRPPKSYTEVNNVDWGYLMPKACLLKEKLK